MALWRTLVIWNVRTAVKKINVFGQSHVDEAARELGIPVFGKLPVDPAYAEKADEGKFFEIDNPYLAAGVETLKNL